MSCRWRVANRCGYMRFQLPRKNRLHWGRRKNILAGEKACKSMVNISFRSDFHNFISPIPLLESRRQRFGNGYYESTISDLVLRSFSWDTIGFSPQLRLCNLDQLFPPLFQFWKGCTLFTIVSTGSTGQFITGAMDDRRFRYMIAGPFLLTLCLQKSAT